jgi:spermidine synthase
VLYIIIFILAYCSITYELVMAQALSAYLGDTVLRYSTTVGLYMASLGIGAFMCRGKLLERPAYSLVNIEILLSVVGGFSVAYLHVFHMFIPFMGIFFLFSHALIICVGILSGFEIPLLIEIKRQEKKESINPVLGVNYFGALIGAVFFPIILLPTIGILLTAITAGLLNVLAGLLLLNVIRRESPEKLRQCYVINVTLLAIFFLCVFFAKPMENYFIAQYLAG